MATGKVAHNMKPPAVPGATYSNARLQRALEVRPETPGRAWITLTFNCVYGTIPWNGEESEP